MTSDHLKSGFGSALTDAVREAAKTKMDEKLEWRIALLGAEYQGAKTYLSTITVAGYGAFFALWAFIAERPPSGLLLWSGLLMIISAAVFIVWTVGSMIWRMKALVRVVSAVKNKDMLKVDALEKRDQQEAVCLMKIWAIAVIVTLALASIALALMVYKILSLLLG